MKSSARNLSLALASSAVICLAACGKSDTKPDAKPDSNGPAESGSEASADPKAFADSYLVALKAKDATKLDGMMLTDGVSAETLEFFKMMREEPAEGTSFSVEVVTPSAEELKEFGEELEMPDGKMYKMPMAPSHVMKVTTETKDANGESKSTSSMPIAEKDGRFVILLPVPAK